MGTSLSWVFLKIRRTRPFHVALEAPHALEARDVQTGQGDVLKHVEAHNLTAVHRLL